MWCGRLFGLLESLQTLLLNYLPLAACLIIAVSFISVTNLSSVRSNNDFEFSDVLHDEDLGGTDEVDVSEFELFQFLRSSTNQDFLFQRKEAGDKNVRYNFEKTAI